MLAKVANYIAVELIDNQLINENDKDIYVFGIKILITQLAHIFIVLILGYAFNLFLECIVFLCTYMPLRIYAGGYHAPTNMHCFLFSILMILMVLLIINNIPVWIIMPCTWGIGLFSVVIIWYYAPVENENKPLDSLEKIVYRKKTRAVIVFIVIGIISSFLFQKINISLTLALALLAESILILLELKKNDNKIKL